jgi:hypothetical protein
MISFTPSYDIGDTVYHATPDGDSGIVIDISYSVRNRHILYKVSYGRRSEDEVLCYEEELSHEKTF